MVLLQITASCTPSDRNFFRTRVMANDALRVKFFEFLKAVHVLISLTFNLGALTVVLCEVYDLSTVWRGLESAILKRLWSFKWRLASSLRSSVAHEDLVGARASFTILVLLSALCETPHPTLCTFSFALCQPVEAKWVHYAELKMTKMCVRARARVVSVGSAPPIIPLHCVLIAFNLYFQPVG